MTRALSIGPAVLFGAAGLFALSTAVQAERASLHLEKPPVAHTGGFGEPTCQACHFGADLNLSGSTLEIVGLGSTYQPGQAHRVTVRLTSFEMGAAGFQASARRAEGARRGRQAGALIPVDGRTEVAKGETGDTQYIQHSRAGSRTNADIVEWTFDWRAPRGAGPVVFHVAANSANGDHSPLEDLVYTTSLQLRPRSE